MRLDVKLHQAPWPLASQSSEPHFIGAHINGLHPFRVTPTRGSTIIDPLRVLDRGETPTSCVSCVLERVPRLGLHLKPASGALSSKGRLHRTLNLNETQIQLSRASVEPIDVRGPPRMQKYVHILEIAVIPMIMVLGLTLELNRLG